MNNRQAQTRPNFDTLCYNRLTSPNFAQPERGISKALLCPSARRRAMLVVNTVAKLIAKIRAGAK